MNLNPAVKAWAGAHPVLTFFIAIKAIWEVSDIVRAAAGAPTSNEALAAALGQAATQMGAARTPPGQVPPPPGKP